MDNNSNLYLELFNKRERERERERTEDLVSLFYGVFVYMLCKVGVGSAKDFGQLELFLNVL